jgi:hypothetical protein
MGEAQFVITWTEHDGRSKAEHVLVVSKLDRIGFSPNFPMPFAGIAGAPHPPAKAAMRQKSRRFETLDQMERNVLAYNRTSGATCGLGGAGEG